MAYVENLKFIIKTLMCIPTIKYVLYYIESNSYLKSTINI